MKVTFDDVPVYHIQEHGLISISKLGDGRMIPCVVLNSKENSELKEFIVAHNEMNGPGDAATQWGIPTRQFFKVKDWVLTVTMHKPRMFNFYILFNLEKHSSVLDAIFQSRGLYISYGFSGEKISKINGKPIVLIEIPDLNQDEKWETTLREQLRIRLKKQGVPKTKLAVEVNKQIAKGREILRYRRSQ